MKWIGGLFRTTMNYWKYARTVEDLEAALEQFREITADLGAGEGGEIEKS